MTRTADGADQLAEPLLGPATRARALEHAARLLRLRRDDPYDPVAWDVSDEQLADIAATAVNAAWSVLTVSAAVNAATSAPVTGLPSQRRTRRPRRPKPPSASVAA